MAKCESEPEFQGVTDLRLSRTREAKTSDIEEDSMARMAANSDFRLWPPSQEFTDDGVSGDDVTITNVKLGLRVVRGRNWRTGKHAWNADNHGCGTVVGLLVLKTN